jgi:hypothetical protein
MTLASGGRFRGVTPSIGADAPPLAGWYLARNALEWSE